MGFFTEYRMYTDTKYRQYVSSGNGMAEAIVRQLVDEIDTRDKCVYIVSKKSRRTDGQWDISQIIVDIFPRTMRPEYPVNADVPIRNYINWRTQCADIAKQIGEGLVPHRYKIHLRLIDINAGKNVVMTRIWNPRTQEYIPMDFADENCVVRRRTYDLRPKWRYEVLSVIKQERRAGRCSRYSHRNGVEQ